MRIYGTKNRVAIKIKRGTWPMDDPDDDDDDDDDDCHPSRVFVADSYEIFTS